MEENFMRVFVMFDLPTHTKQARKSYARFRKRLIYNGFSMLQYSVYMRICKGITSANNHIQKLRGILPPAGHVRAFVITEKQFDAMQILLGEPSVNEVKNAPLQLTLF